MSILFFAGKNYVSSYLRFLCSVMSLLYKRLRVELLVLTQHVPLKKTEAKQKKRNGDR